jgi:hypothetical protein
MKQLSCGLAMLGMLVLPVLSPADDSERKTSIYDKHPECMERTEGGAPNSACIVQDGPPNRQGLATRNQQNQGQDQGQDQGGGNGQRNAAPSSQISGN